MAEKFEAMVMADSVRVKIKEKLIKQQELEDDWGDYMQGLRVVDQESAMSFNSSGEQDLSVPRLDLSEMSPMSAIFSRKQSNVCFET